MLQTWVNNHQISLDNIANVLQSNDETNKNDEVVEAQHNLSPSGSVNVTNGYSPLLDGANECAVVNVAQNEASNVDEEIDEYLCGFSMSDFIESCCEGEAVEVPKSNFQ